MIKIADILLFTGLGLVFIYFIVSIASPFIYRRRNKKQLFVVALIPCSLILFSFLGYYIKNQSLSRHLLPKAYGVIEANLDSLNNELKLDTISFQRVDTIVNQIQLNQEEIKRIIAEQEELQRRVRIKQFNKRISDSILMQIQLRIKEIEVKKNYSIETKLITSNGKILMHNGKIVVSAEKIFKDRYTIDSLEIYPILKKIQFNSNSSFKGLNFYIDSLEINFTVVSNQGKAINNSSDSLVFITISPPNAEYKSYIKFQNSIRQEINVLDSLFFKENYHNEIKIDFPNTRTNDTTICFEFYLKRGLLSSFCLSFN